MALDYRKCAQEIFSQLGGRDNIVSAAHCATRLRLVIVDNSKVNISALENTEGVKGVFNSNGQLQLIIGTGTVNKVYEEFLAVTGLTAATKDEVKAAAAAKQPLYKRLIKTLGDVFVPIIPAIVASGFLMGIMEALNFMVNNGFLSIDTSSSIYVFAQLFSNTAYVFLPILIAFSAAKVFGGNPFLGAVIGMIMIHPNLQNAWTVATNGVNVMQPVFFGLYSVPLVGYQGHVIPVIIAVWVMCFIEKKLHKIVPAMIDLFVTPLVSVFVTGYLTLAVIGPVFTTVENGIIGGIQWLLTLPFGIGSFVMGGLYAITVVAGIHHMYTIIDMGQLSQFGLTYWLPLASAANVAQGGATLAVALKTKDMKVRSMALPSALSSFMGITEPAIFGVNLRFMTPFVSALVGGAFGALYASIVGLGASGTGVTGIFGLLLHLHAPLHYIIMMAISGGIAFVLTLIFWKDPSAAAEKGEKREKASDPIMSTEAGTILAPTQGKVVPYTEIPDETFAAGILGRGVGIVPEKGVVTAPFDGEITSVTDTHHAVCVTGPGEMELLIHVGVDTVKMNGDGFKCLVKDGDKVTAGQELIRFDRKKIAAAGYSDMVVVLLTNCDEYKDFQILTGGGQMKTV